MDTWTFPPLPPGSLNGVQSEGPAGTAAKAEAKNREHEETGKLYQTDYRRGGFVEKTINLFHCLSELKYDFVEKIQKKLSSGNLSAQNLTSAQWLGLVFVLQMSEETSGDF